jgi:hypothetical protein
MLNARSRSNLGFCLSKVSSSQRSFSQSVVDASDIDTTSKTCDNIDGNIPVAHKCIDLVVVGGKAAQLHLFGVLNIFCITVTPFQRHLRVLIGVDQYVESAITIEHR